jgi:hypothetical protein
LSTAFGDRHQQPERADRLHFLLFDEAEDRNKSP